MQLQEVPVKVAIRVRPLIGDERHKAVDICTHCFPEKCTIGLSGKPHGFVFDHVFDESTKQVDVYDVCIAPLVKTVIEGYNATVFAYGQTGTGKTFTMGTGSYVTLNGADELGVVPRAVTEIFSEIQARKSQVLCKVSVSFIEVYMEDIKDLLAIDDLDKDIHIREDDAGNTVVSGIQETTASCLDEVMRLLEAGTAMRHVGATKINDYSSRSHCIFSIGIDQYPLHPEETESGSSKHLSSKFHFVDLAGSERSHRTGNRGERFKESVYINTGLLALGNVISALADPKRRSQHVPYRDSKLTRLLKDSLGGNSRTVMIACLSPCLADLDENLNTVKYATRARNITNRPIVNVDIENVKLERMRTEINMLRGELSRRLSDASEHGKIEPGVVEIEAEKEKLETDCHVLVTCLHEVNSLLKMFERMLDLPPDLQERLSQWRRTWCASKSERPSTAPASGKCAPRSVVDEMKAQLLRYRDQLACDEGVFHDKQREIMELRNEVHVFGEENAQLRLDVFVARDQVRALKEQMQELQLRFDDCRRPMPSSSRPPSTRFFTAESPRRHSAQPELEERLPLPQQAMTADELLMAKFRAKSNLLMAQLDDLDEVAHDDDITSSEDEAEVEERAQLSRYQTEPVLKRHGDDSLVTMPFTAPSAMEGAAFRSSNLNGERLVGVRPSKLPVRRKHVRQDKDAIRELQRSHDWAKNEARIADSQIKDVANRMKELELSIQQKEKLIQDLARSEGQAKQTSGVYKARLNRLEKEVESSKKDLDDARQKIALFERGNSKDASLKMKLEGEYKRKLSSLEAKISTFKEKESNWIKISSLQENNSKKVQDLDGWVARMKNQKIELERKLKVEAEKKAKFEQEVKKYELRIRELETKSDQQQKLLKRKNEEVIAAQKKLRAGNVSINNGAMETVDNKQEWIDKEIEKIIERQREIDRLQAELEERDMTLQKKEVLMAERDALQMKRIRSSQMVTKDILRVSSNIERVDQELATLDSARTKGGKQKREIEKLMHLKEDLLAQKANLEEKVGHGLVDVAEEDTRLIELDEALDAVEVAIKCKTDVINETEEYLEKSERFSTVESLLHEMGNITYEECKHLIANLFGKVIELKQKGLEQDDIRCHFEIKVSEQEKQVSDLRHTIQIMEALSQQRFTEQQSGYEKEIQFLLEQLRNMEEEVLSKDSNKVLEKKIHLLEKDLHYYKRTCRELKDRLKEQGDHSAVSGAADDVTVSSDQQLRLVQMDSKRMRSHSLQTDGGHDADIHLPPVPSQQSTPVKERPSDRSKFTGDQPNVEEAKRLKEIFESRPPASPSLARAARRALMKDSLHGLPVSKTADDRFADSIEVGRGNRGHASQQ